MIIMAIKMTKTRLATHTYVISSSVFMIISLSQLYVVGNLSIVLTNDQAPSKPPSDDLNPTLVSTHLSVVVH